MMPEPAAQPAPKPLPEYTCGSCKRVFGTNFAVEEIECAECDARRCPYCREWFGGEDTRFSVDEEFPATWHGGHALVIEFGDEEMLARCQCGERFGAVPPSGSMDDFGTRWERHVMTRGGRNA